MKELTIALCIVLSYVLFCYSIAVGVCGKTTLVAQGRVYHWAKEYIKDNSADGWTAKNIDWFTVYREKNFYRIFIHMWQKDKWIPFDRWEYATCGELWFDNKGNLIKDDMVTKDWKK
jgi:hypothetical protein